jgi:translation elongation factor EF-1alpha
MLETDSLEMKFSKQKENIVICIRENIKSVVVYINCIDEVECSYAYYMEVSRSEMEKGVNEVNETKNNEMILGMGLGEIMKRGGDFFKDSKRYIQ